MEAEATITSRHDKTVNEAGTKMRSVPITVSYLEDDKSQQTYVANVLKRHRYSCQLYSTARDMQQAFLDHRPCDIALLDVDLGPEESGLDMVRFLRNFQHQDLPVIMLSARQSHDDITTLINAGANDYLTKPVREADLIHTIKTYVPDIETKTEIRMYGSYIYGGYVDDTVNRCFSLNGKPLPLSNVDYAIAQLLFRSAGRLVTHSMILNAASTAGLNGFPRIESLIHRFKKKIGLRESTGFRLEVFHACGYRMTGISPATNVQPRRLIRSVL